MIVESVENQQSEPPLIISTSMIVVGQNELQNRTTTSHRKKKRMTNLERIMLKLNAIAAKEEQRKTSVTISVTKPKKRKMNSSDGKHVAADTQSLEQKNDQNDTTCITDGTIKSPISKVNNGSNKPSNRKKRLSEATSESMKINVDYKKDASPEHIAECNYFESDDYDDTGSVKSGILEEDICFTCGIVTNDSGDWKNVILCDNCNAEFHIKCVGLESIPESDFICQRCIQENEHFKDLDFFVSDSFDIPKDIKTPQDICYSPSRPLEAAWEECKSKGFMVVSNLLSYEIMKKLTHGTVQRFSKSGRIVDQWDGALKEIAKRVNLSACHDIVNRDGRYDLTIPRFVILDLQIESLLQPILDKLRTIMGSPTPQLRTHSIVFAPVGSKAQNWHVDDAFDNSRIVTHRYFTILVHLNPIDSFCGGTEIWSNSLNRGDMIRGRPGDALVFNGSMLHRGQGNDGRCHRFFYYASFSCKADENTSQI